MSVSWENSLEALGDRRNPSHLGHYFIKYNTNNAKQKTTPAMPESVQSQTCKPMMLNKNRQLQAGHTSTVVTVTYPGLVSPPTCSASDGLVARVLARRAQRIEAGHAQVH